MEKFSLHATDSSFHISTEPEEYEGVASARSAGLESATALATDEINAGSPASVVEVCVEDSDNVVVDRSVVSLSVAKLHIK